MKSPSAFRFRLPAFATAVAAAVLCVAAAARADKLLIVPQVDSGRGPYVLDTVTGEKTTPFDGAYYEGTPGPAPQPPGNPIPTPPPGDNVVQQVTAISKAHLQGKNEADALIAVIDKFAAMEESGALTVDQVTTVFKTSIPLIEAKLGTGGRLKTWYDAVASLGTFDAPFLRKVIAGLEGAFGSNAKAVRDAIVTAQNMIANGTGRAEAVKRVAATAKEPIAIDVILQIVQMIIQILQTLGWLPS